MNLSAGPCINTTAIRQARREVVEDYGTEQR